MQTGRHAGRLARAAGAGRREQSRPLLADFTQGSRSTETFIKAGSVAAWRQAPASDPQARPPTGMDPQLLFKKGVCNESPHPGHQPRALGFLGSLAGLPVGGPGQSCCGAPTTEGEAGVTWR